MCTSLTYTDANGGVYFGRTLELDIEEPYFVTYVPAGTPFHSDAEGSEPLHFEAKQPFIAITAPIRFPTKENPLGPSDMKSSEGMNLAAMRLFALSNWRDVVIRNFWIESWNELNPREQRSQLQAVWSPDRERRTRIGDPESPGLLLVNYQVGKERITRQADNWSSENAGRLDFDAELWEAWDAR